MMNCPSISAPSASPSCARQRSSEKTRRARTQRYHGGRSWKDPFRCLGYPATRPIGSMIYRKRIKWIPYGSTSRYLIYLNSIWILKNRCHRSSNFDIMRIGLIGDLNHGSMMMIYMEFKPPGREATWSMMIYPPVIQHGWLENPLPMEVSS